MPRPIRDSTAHSTGRQLRTWSRRGVALALCCGAVVSTACRPRAATSDEPPAPRAPDDPTTWVRTWDPAATEPGFVLDFWYRRTPTLIDRSGRIVHRWPNARMKSRVRMERDGSLLGLALGPAVVHHSWTDELLWQYRFEGELPHHDVIRLRNGQVLTITRRDGTITDDLVAIDPATQEITWRWRSEDHLGELLERAAPADRDSPTHMNSVQELPDNPWFASGDRRFGPGNLLVSSRNLNTVFIVDRQTGAIVWDFQQELDLQHEALMVGPGHPRSGQILVLSNGTRGRFRYRQTALLVVDPVRSEVIWRYASPSFFTTTGGVQQPLPNGNVLLTSTRGGRVFEIDTDGEIVWEWTPPFDPTRAQWVPMDWAPQLAETDVPAPRRVTSTAPFVERRAYRFGHRRDARPIEIDGERDLALRSPDLCSRVHLPPLAELTLRHRVRPTGEAGPVTFHATVRALAEQEASIPGAEDATLPDDTVVYSSTTDSVIWHRASVSLSEWSNQSVVLCVAARASGGGDPAGQWLLPDIHSAGDDATGRARSTSEAPALTDEEQQAARKHLERMGYLN